MEGYALFAPACKKGTSRLVRLKVSVEFHGTVFEDHLVWDLGTP